MDEKPVTKVYVVMCGSYSDKFVDSVYSTKEGAETRMKELGEDADYWEEFILDKPAGTTDLQEFTPHD